VYAGYDISPHYDSMIAKIIAAAPDRPRRSWIAEHMGEARVGQVRVNVRELVREAVTSEFTGKPATPATSPTEEPAPPRTDAEPAPHAEPAGEEQPPEREREP
jgi:acetyl/propionyl-CoA carboxylase alpha subunit